MTQEHRRAVLWDLDGTVLDSRDVHWEAWRLFTSRLGRPMTYEFFDGTFGTRNEITLREHLGAGLTDVEVERYSLEKEALYRELLSKAPIQTLPGVREWLEWAASHGWRQALASMAPRENIEVTLAALCLTHSFQAIVSAEEVHHGKPDPEVFLLAAERLGVPPARCTVIEDSTHGIEAARRAGMRSIGVGPLHKSLKADMTLPTLAHGNPERLDQE